MEVRLSASTKSPLDYANHLSHPAMGTRLLRLIEYEDGDWTDIQQVPRRYHSMIESETDNRIIT